MQTVSSVSTVNCKLPTVQNYLAVFRARRVQHQKQCTLTAVTYTGFLPVRDWRLRFLPVRDWRLGFLPVRDWRLGFLPVRDWRLGFSYLYVIGDWRFSYFEGAD